MKIALIIVDDSLEINNPCRETKPRMTVLSADTDHEFQSALHDCMNGKSDKLTVSFKRSAPEEMLSRKPISPATETEYTGQPLRLSLTRTQRQIMEYLSEYMMYKEIALKLNRSINTIKTHIRKIYKQLGVHTMDEAVEKYKLQKS
jgi:DNA-binding NarL/FixJ family response regulator